MPALEDIPPWAKGETWEHWQAGRLRESVTLEGRQANRSAIADDKAKMANSEQRKREQERKPETPAAKPVFGKGKAA